MSAQPLPGYCEHLQYVVGEAQSLMGEQTLCRNFRTVKGIGVMDILSERGWIPIIAGEIFQPYYADSVRPSLVSKELQLVERGRPDAVIDLLAGRTFEQVVSKMPRAENKRRQWRKSDSLEWGFIPQMLPWRVSGQHLMLKYDQRDVSAAPDKWFDLPVEWWNCYRWITLKTASKLLGGAIFQVKPDGSEWFWIASAVNYDDEQALDVGTGNLLLMKAVQMAVREGASVFNFGVDRFDYKPQVWGTMQRWTTGLSYS